MLDTMGYWPEDAIFDNSNLKAALKGYVLNVSSECVILWDDAFPLSKIISYNTMCQTSLYAFQREDL